MVQSGTIPTVIKNSINKLCTEEIQGDLWYFSEDWIIVHKLDSANCVHGLEKGLFFADAKGQVAHVLINTVDRIKEKTQLNSSMIPIKLEIQDIIGRPSTKDSISNL